MKPELGHDLYIGLPCRLIKTTGQAATFWRHSMSGTRYCPVSGPSSSRVQSLTVPSIVCSSVALSPLLHQTCAPEA